MDETINASMVTNVDDEQSTEYLLRRVFRPREAKTSRGTTVFRTSDNVVYARMADGSIRRSTPKVNGKQAKKLRRAKS